MEICEKVSATFDSALNHIKGLEETCIRQTLTIKKLEILTKEYEKKISDQELMISRLEEALSRKKAQIIDMCHSVEIKEVQSLKDQLLEKDVEISHLKHQINSLKMSK